MITTLDEAILYFREKAENSKKDEEVRFAMRSKYCKDIYNQTGVHIDAGDIDLTEYNNCLKVAEWLTELKQRQEQDKPQGEWIEHKLRNDIVVEYAFKCSKCKEDSGLPYRTDFCPNCGAQMQIGGAE